MNWQNYLETHQSDFIERLLDFLRIPSISSLPEHAADVRRAGEWVMAQLRNAGMEHVEMMETGGHPVVYADWLHAPGKPTVMIYGHFDVQPVDPIALWENPPFEPVIKNDRVYARGASDDKGNMLAPILALEALLKTEGRLPVNVKCFFEGQEEIGSPTLPAFIAAHKEKFACDFILSADGGQWDETQPALLVGLKGLCALQIDVVGPAYDVHSGLYGGVIQNPIHALAAILASMRSSDGRILVEGFYDDVVPLSEADRAELARVPYDEEEVRRKLNIDAFFGEPGYTPLERAWTRPTLEINGIWGGFQGEGVKTVLPSEAHAKITCRLVANQRPERIAQLVKAHVERHTPPGVRVKTTILENGALPYLMPADHPGNLAARDVLVEEYGKEPFLARSGGSIPVTAMFLESLGAYTVSFGFALNDERQHSPNEFFRLANFQRGQRAYCKLLYRLAA
ncbi:MULTISPECIES: dipeptidase [Caldilinea]|jgi:acetylornithine deacetylase/succinyl-diaminopimelate desuccinylase-like protein|uniref:dipeptidase n=1 Tax=Caldilinea TaxID=233191 RepID=UPI0003190C74|nr:MULTISPECIES: dipeptidase [Caldilinea]MBO9393019.1 dipeptidase [Caldilinea sp.]GIV74464.1 MAG: peptidase M20 [Caldilinea sp.]